MIVRTEDLAEYRGIVTMVDGGFDPLHGGHIAYFREAAKLGRPVLCNVSHDAWVSRKHPPLLAQAERIEIVDAIRYVDYTHPSTTTTAKVLELLQPKYYAKGEDWRGKLPQDEVDACRAHEIEIVHLDTVTHSSTEILERFANERG